MHSSSRERPRRPQASASKTPSREMLEPPERGAHTPPSLIFQRTHSRHNSALARAARDGPRRTRLVRHLLYEAVPPRGLLRARQRWRWCVWMAGRKTGGCAGAGPSLSWVRASPPGGAALDSPSHAPPPPAAWTHSKRYAPGGGVHCPTTANPAPPPPLRTPHRRVNPPPPREPTTTARTPPQLCQGGGCLIGQRVQAQRSSGSTTCSLPGHCPLPCVSRGGRGRPR